MCTMPGRAGRVTRVQDPLSPLSLALTLTLSPHSPPPPPPDLLYLAHHHPFYPTFLPTLELNVVAGGT